MRERGRGWTAVPGGHFLKAAMLAIEIWEIKRYRGRIVGSDISLGKFVDEKSSAERYSVRKIHRIDHGCRSDWTKRSCFTGTSESWGADMGIVKVLWC